MNASLQLKAAFRAGALFLGCWLLVLGVALIAYHGFLPHRIEKPVFLLSSGCIFPYEGSGFPEIWRGVLTVAHWVLSIVIFAYLGRRLPARWVVLVALVTIPTLAFLASAVCTVAGRL
jgi:hypothetical protein